MSPSRRRKRLGGVGRHACCSWLVWRWNGVVRSDADGGSKKGLGAALGLVHPSDVVRDARCSEIDLLKVGERGYPGGHSSSNGFGEASNHVEVLAMDRPRRPYLPEVPIGSLDSLSDREGLRLKTTLHGARLRRRGVGARRK